MFQRAFVERFQLRLKKAREKWSEKMKASMEIKPSGKMDDLLRDPLDISAALRSYAADIELEFEDVENLQIQNVIKTLRELAMEFAALPSATQNDEREAVSKSDFFDPFMRSVF